jgi:FtsP/CotA-like multicopper oxidase with cupredoxin domain
MTTRRSFLKMTMAAAAAAGMPWHMFIQKAYGVPLAAGLSDPAKQPKFLNPVPNALNPAFIYQPKDGNKYNIQVKQAVQETGLKVQKHGENTGKYARTTVWGYGDGSGPFAYSWPGRTFEVQSGKPIDVKWENRLDQLPIPVSSFGRSVVDTSLHWAYSLHGYTQYSLENDGFPIVPHVHGGHSDFQFDGNPEFFFSPNFVIRGPQWRDRTYTYKNDQPAGTVWYHDHALGITRLNVYAGMAGFFIIRDDDDTGRPGNTLSLPTYPFEAALAIQDKMFDANGGLFYPAYPGDPFYDDFITGEGAVLPPEIFPGGGPTALAEFFGDHMVVNGLIWPKMEVEPRNYRLRLLNGCDSRFLVVRFREAASTTSTDLTGAGSPIPFTVIGSDQGLASSPTTVDTLVMETGSRYDIIFDFDGLYGKRIIMENIGGDSPFGFAYGDDLEPEDVFPDRQTDRVMAFDVNQTLSSVPDVTPHSAALSTYAASRKTDFGAYQLPIVPDRIRKVALFEGTDEFGRLQPLLGTAEPATDYNGDPIYWPNESVYANAGLTGQMEGAVAWHSPTTENPNLGDTEEWEIFNVTGDSHPVHLHLVHFEVIGRQDIVWDSHTIGPDDPSGEEEDRVIPNALYSTAAGDGTYLETQSVVQHNGLLGNGFVVRNATASGTFKPMESEYVDGNSPKDMVTARPSEVTFIKAKFDKPGRYVWHCHILSHEDHEMMRVLLVGEEPNPGEPKTPGGGGKGKGKKK